MMTARLWELSDDLETLAAEIAENGGELTPEIEARLDMLEGAFDEKVERIALLIREKLGLAELAKNEADRITAIRKSHENAADGLKRYLLDQMRRSGHTKVETHRARVRVQKNGQPSIRWTKSLDDLPDAYRRITIAPDISLVRDQLKAGDTPPEGFTVEYGQHVRIF